MPSGLTPTQRVDAGDGDGDGDGVGDGVPPPTVRTTSFEAAL
jgi:hypothetical protein